MTLISFLPRGSFCHQALSPLGYVKREHGAGIVETVPVFDLGIKKRIQAFHWLSATVFPLVKSGHWARSTSMHLTRLSFGSR